MNQALPSLPPLQMATTATSGAKGGSQGGASGGVSGGDWIINSGAGSSSGMTTKTWLMLAITGAVAWALFKKKA